MSRHHHDLLFATGLCDGDVLLKSPLKSTEDLFRAQAVKIRALEFQRKLLYEEKANLQKDLNATRRRMSQYETAHAALKRKCLRDKEHIATLEMEVIISLRPHRP